MAIIISQNGKNAVKLDKTAFEKEGWLQEYIYDNPESIPLYDIKEDIRLLILAREFSTNSGPIDAIGIDKEGEIYIIETKLYKNPDKRTVVAQALDYGAALWKHSSDFNEFIALLNDSVQKTFKVPFNQKLQEYFGLSDEELSQLLDSVKNNLSKGVLRFVILMDILDDRLKDLILYVNQNSQFDIYAVELEYYKHDTYEIVIPRIYGAEVKKDIAVSSGSNSPRRKWTEEELLQFAKKEMSPDVYKGLEKLYHFSKQNADSVSLGTGTSRGSFGPIFEKISPRTIFTLRTNGILSFNFAWLNRPKEADNFRQAYFAEMKKIGFDLEGSDIDKFPQFQPEEWLSKTDKLIATLKNLLG
jgi:hypothetical protein